MVQIHSPLRHLMWRQHSFNKCITATSDYEYWNVPYINGPKGYERNQNKNFSYENNILSSSLFASHFHLSRTIFQNKVRERRYTIFAFYFLKYFYSEVPQASHIFFKLYFTLILVLKYDFCIIYDFYFTLMIMMWFNGYNLRLEELVPWGFKWAGDCVLLEECWY